VYQYNDKGTTDHCDDHCQDALRYLVQQIEAVGIPWADAQKDVLPRFSYAKRKSNFTNRY